MNTFYNSLSDPIYYTITLILPLICIIYIYKIRKRFLKLTLLGFLFGTISAIIAGLVRVISRLELFSYYSDWFGALPLPFLLLTFIFFIIGGFQSTKQNQEKRSRVILGTLLLVTSILLGGAIVLYKFYE
ncbi:hypothetical protein [Paenibacillus yanchengensis]|uniref:Uncharacterized protein n=1 Tax=Paenibacillus yanchengensis TaxID=2035833 RepID=A0ABW4YIW7_9BACL